MHTALDVYDVMNSIFHMLEPQDLYHLALTRSRWSPLAVQNLWRNVTAWDLYKFFVEQQPYSVRDLTFVPAAS